MKRESDAVRLICEAMLELLEEKPMEKITVKELTEKACVSRSSFYIYFDSAYAVLERLEEDFLGGQLSEMQVALVNVKGRNGKIKQEVLRDAGRYLESNSRTLRILKRQDPSFTRKVEARAARTINLTLQQPDIQMTDAEKKLFTRYYVGSMMACLDWIAFQKEPEMGFADAAIFMSRLICASLDCVSRNE